MHLNKLNNFDQVNCIFNLNDDHLNKKTGYFFSVYFFIGCGTGLYCKLFIALTY